PCRLLFIVYLPLIARMWVYGIKFQVGLIAVHPLQHNALAVITSIRLTEILVIFVVEICPNYGFPPHLDETDANHRIVLSCFRITCLLEIAILSLRNIYGKHRDLGIVKSHKSELLTIW